jgi:peroxiredoxin
VAFLAALLLSGCDRGTRPNLVGHHAPDFTVSDSDRKVELRRLEGPKVVVLNFWATWCPPCVEEMPSLSAMQTELQDRVQVLGVSIDEDSDAYHRFLEERGIRFLTVRDPERRSADLYGTVGWPETYVIDRQGVIRRKFIGPVDWTEPEMLAYLTSLSSSADK